MKTNEKKKREKKKHFENENASYHFEMCCKPALTKYEMLDRPLSV